MKRSDSRFGTQGMLLREPCALPWTPFAGKNRLLVVVFCLFLTGCFELETRVRLNPDGSATVTERLSLSQRLLDLGNVPGSDTPVAQLLTREAVEARLKHLGKGVWLAEHRVQDGPHGSRESICVFEVSDINDFRYASPLLSYTDYSDNNLIRIEMVPLLKSRNYAGTAGEMALAFRPVSRPKSEVKPKEGEPPPAEPSPLELQALRDLQPVVRTILKDFKLRLTFDCYAPISVTGFGWRDRKAGTNVIDVLAVTDRDLDKWGVKILENEEIMLDLLRGRFGSLNIVETVKDFQDNPTVPVFLPWGSAHAPWRQSDEICFKSSRELFDRHFQGKMLDFDRWQSTGKNIRPARFDEVGWTPPRKLRANEGDR